jgi:hypothetical protein
VWDGAAVGLRSRRPSGPFGGMAHESRASTAVIFRWSPSAVPSGSQAWSEERVISFGSGTGEGADPGGRRTRHEAGHLGGARDGGGAHGRSGGRTMAHAEPQWGMGPDRPGGLPPGGPGGDAFGARARCRERSATVWDRSGVIRCGMAGCLRSRRPSGPLRGMARESRASALATIGRSLLRSRLVFETS